MQVQPYVLVLKKWREALRSNVTKFKFFGLPSYSTSHTSTSKLQHPLMRFTEFVQSTILRDIPIPMTATSSLSYAAILSEQFELLVSLRS